ncbi:HdeA family protein [Microbacteriaceae bacterium K1510]|nr:HdeA family protein [Microbacteriaceae bacterium K1510]
MIRTIFLVSAVMAGAAAMPATAQVNLDMNQITCGDWLGYDQPSREFVGYWMSGYYSATRNDNVLDFRRLKQNSEKVASYCKKHKSEPLPKAINRLKT